MGSDYGKADKMLVTFSEVAWKSIFLTWKSYKPGLHRKFPLPLKFLQRALTFSHISALQPYCEIEVISFSNSKPINL